MLDYPLSGIISNVFAQVKKQSYSLTHFLIFFEVHSETIENFKSQKMIKLFFLKLMKIAVQLLFQNFQKSRKLIHSKLNKPQATSDQIMSNIFKKTLFKIGFNNYKMDQEKSAQTSVFFWGFLNKKKQEEVVPKIIQQLNKSHITKVKSGGFFLLASNDSGQLWAWGNPKYNRYGISGQQQLMTPVKIPLKIKVRNISAGNWHSMIIDFEGNLHGCGHNKYGAIGLKHFENVNQFTQVPIENKFKQISAGDGFSLAITSQGQLMGTGHHEYNGRASKQNKNTFKNICQEQKFVKVSAGFTHSLAISIEGSVYSWGQGNFFQLGHGNKNDQKTPKKIQKLNGVKIVDVSCTRGQKYAHSMAVSEGGQVFTWGSGYKGKLGHFSEWSHADPADQAQPKMIKDIEGIIRASGGGIHSAVLSSDGALLTFGCGSDGRLGHPESSQHRYLYRQGLPRKLQTLSEWQVIDFCCSYYQNICVARKKQK